jgi:hypothetical protein
MFLVSGIGCILIGVHMIIYPMKAKENAPWPWNLLTERVGRVIGALILLGGWYWMHMYRSH